MFAFVITTVTIGMESFAITTVMLALIGAFIIPILPVGYSFAVEVAYPVGEAQALGVMITLAQISSTGMGAVLSTMLATEPPMRYESLYAIIGIAVAGFLCSIPVRQKLNKTAGEAKSTINTDPTDSDDP